jgi:hypothetical protein
LTIFKGDKENGVNSVFINFSQIKGRTLLRPEHVEGLRKDKKIRWVIISELMLIFIDDSGDPGFKLKKGSSAVFVIVMVIFKDNLVAEETALCIKKLKRELGFRDEYEFKFNKCSRDLRMKFLQSIRKYNFDIRAIVVIKEKIFSQTLRGSKDKFYNFIVRNLLSHYEDKFFDKATVKIEP